MLFAYLQGKDNINATENLAKHLSVTVDDVNEWLNGESLPDRNLIGRLVTIIRGDNYFTSVSFKDTDDNVKTESWAKVIEIIHQAANVQAFYNLKLTSSKK